MKALLGCLMCLVLTMSQAFAVPGGPFGRFGSITLTGTYAGVLTPIPVVVDPGPPPVTLPPDNSLGLFSLAIAPQGLGTGSTPANAVVGAAVIFRKGIVYSGAATPSGTGSPPPGIIGSADPLTGKLSAIVSTSGTVSISGDSTANGTFDTTKILPNTKRTLSTVALIRGQAAITYRSTDPVGDSGGSIQYKVRGFKQSDLF